MDLGFGKYTTTTAGSTLNMFVYPVADDQYSRSLTAIMRFFTVPSVKDAFFRWLSADLHCHSCTPPHPLALPAKLNLHGTVNTAVKAGGDLLRS